MDTPDIRRRLETVLRARGDGLACAYLFGSHATGRANEASDVDLAILYRETPPATIAGLGLSLARDIEDQIGRRVDLVVLNRAPVDLVHRVLRDGVLVHEGDRSARVRFEVRSRNEYFDLLPHLERYRRKAAVGRG